MNPQLQGSNITYPNSFNRDGLRVEFQPGQFPQTQKPIKLIKDAFIGIGITQIVIGVICIILNIVQIVSLNGRVSYVGYGIWGGVFFFISGLLSLLTGKKSTTKCLIVSTMVMNINSAILAVSVFILSVIDAEFYTVVYKPVLPGEGWIGSVIAALALVETIISIVCSSLCCNAYCCCSKVDKVDAIQGYPGNLFYTNDSDQFPQTQKPVKSVKNAFTGIGIVQILIGTTCFTINIVQLVMAITYICATGYGIWGGTFFFISGMLTLITGKTSTNKCLIVSSMIMNIISTVAAVAVLILGLIEAITYNPSYVYNGKLNLTGIGSTIATLAIIETVISIASSALYCNDYCCCASGDDVVVIYGNPENLSYLKDSGFQAPLMFPAQLSQPVPFLQQPLLNQPSLVHQQPLASQNNGFQMDYPPPYDSNEKY